MTAFIQSNAACGPNYQQMPVSDFCSTCAGYGRRGRWQ